MTANSLDSRDVLLAMLDWYRAAGVDIAVSETAIDRFAAARAARVASTPAAPRPAQGYSQGVSTPPPPAPATGNTDAPNAEATALAREAPDLDSLREKLGAFEGCGLKLRATNLVFADGNPSADLMLVGEAPGREEDLQGKPFVGRSGQLLDRMLAAIGRDRETVYIANTVPWRPPGNRKPSPSEVAACLPFLHRQIELVAPRVLVALGGAAASHLFETEVGITRLRGEWRDLEINGHAMAAMATLHPAYLLRQPAAKRLAWQDLLSVRARLDTDQDPPPVG